MRRVYGALLRLYPRDFRAMFAPEMLCAFEIVCKERRTSAIRECVGLLAGAASEWIAKLTANCLVRGRVLPDRLLMRPPGVSWDAHYQGKFVQDRRCS